jgi:hypothetical protein
MLRAEAAEFMPQDNIADCGTLCYEGVDGVEMCSTAAPSPAMTATDQADLAVSPMLSPYWGYEYDPATADEAALWNAAAAAALYGGYMSEDCSFMPDLMLPDSDDNYIDSMHGPEYVSKAEFILEGMDALQNSLAGFLSGYPLDEKKACNDDTAGETTNLSPPPGLDAPPGLEDYDVDYSGDCQVEAPPGLEITVADLHARLQTGANKKSAASLVLPRGTTTAMLRNIPNKYTQLGLVSRLYEGGYRGLLDFIYLPIDFKNKCNVGYAFVNFRTAEACARFANEYHGSNSRDKLPGYNSKKICEVSAARYQGCDENVRRLQISSVMPELMATPEWLPKLFDEAGKEVDFPLPDAGNSVSDVQNSRPARGRLQRRKGSSN